MYRTSIPLTLILLIGVGLLTVNSQTVCKSNQYLTGTGTCDWCDSTCASCYGPASNQCFTCYQGWYFIGGSCYSNSPCASNQFLLGNTCVNQCPQGFISNTFRVCVSTNIASTLPVICSSQNQYNDNGVCKHCEGTCKTCFGGASNNCLSCYDGWFFLNNQCTSTFPCAANQFLYQNVCLSQCPAGFDANDDKVCVPISGNVILSCPRANQFYDRAENKCKSCHGNCATCFGEESNQCITCYSGWFLWANQCSTSFPCQQTEFLFSNVCTTQCPPGYTANADRVCVQIQQGSAITSCQYRNQYIDVTLNQCVFCSPSCASCFGKEANQCTSCYEGWYYLNGECRQIFPCQKGQFFYLVNCVNSCPPGTKPDEYYVCRTSTVNCTYTNQYVDVNAQCKDCDVTCALCSSPYGKCLKCVLYWYLQGDKCYQICPNGLKGNDQTGFCE